MLWRFSVSSVCAGFITLLMSAGLPVLAQQSPSGKLTGTIYDQAGARLDHAAIVLKNAATGAESTTHPSDKGEYRFENLPVGKYSIRVSATGLSTVQINEVLIQTNKTANINVTLPVADSTPISVVEVSEAPQPVDTPTPAAAASHGDPPPPPPDPVEEAKAVVREIANIRERLALSAYQQNKIRDIFTARQNQIAALRADPSLLQPARREKVKAVRADAEAKFRAVLNENQLDEYEEILKERRERAVEQQKNPPSPH